MSTSAPLSGADAVLDATRRAHVATLCATAPVEISLGVPRPLRVLARAG